MFIYSSGGFKIWVRNKFFKAQVKDDHEESEKLLLQTKNLANEKQLFTFKLM